MGEGNNCSPTFLSKDIVETVLKTILTVPFEENEKIKFDKFFFHYNVTI